MKTYKDLVIWQKAMDLAEETYKIISRLPREEKYGLSDQMRRAAVSVPSNIAEGYGRYTHQEFSRFLRIAYGSVCELETQALLCIRIGLLTAEQAHSLLALCSENGKLLLAFIASLKN